MLAKIAAAAAAVASVLRSYPAASSGLINVAVVLLARLGFNVTPDQLTAIVVLLTAALSAAVHASVTPTVRLNQATGSGG